MQMNARNRKGFTIIEFGIMMGLLAVILVAALPQVMKMELQAKRSELPTNVQGIKVAQLQYHEVYGSFITCSPYPASPSTSPQRWERWSSGGFSTIGWSPKTEVRGSYSVSMSATDFDAYGVSDLDGDGVYATYQATRFTDAGLKTEPGIY